MEGNREAAFNNYIKTYTGDPKFRKYFTFPTFKNYKKFIKVLRGTSDEPASFQWKVKRKFKLGKDCEQWVLLDKNSGKKILYQENFVSVLREFHDSKGKYIFYGFILWKL